VTEFPVVAGLAVAPSVVCVEIWLMASLLMNALEAALPRAWLTD
jgi:hypothetical protein